MVKITRALEKHKPGIQRLLQLYSDMSFSDALINRTDLALVAVVKADVVGFLYGGLMGNKTICYLDKFCIDPAYSKQGIGNQLAKRAYSICLEKGVEEVIGFIRQGKHHDQSGMNALKLALGADSHPYTHVRGQMKFIESTVKETYGW